MDLDLVRNDPNINLAKSRLQCLLEAGKKPSGFRSRFSVHDQTQALIAKGLVLVAPSPFEEARMSYESPGLRFQFPASLCELNLLDQRPIVIPDG